MTDHAGDLLSSLLDGELSVGDVSRVRAHVVACADCARELDDVRLARQVVRSLPAVDPPVPLLRRATRPRAARANVAASVAAGLVLLALSASGIGPGALQPEVSGAVERHASTVSALQAGGVMQAGPRLQPGYDVSPTTAPRREVDEAEAPQSLAGYELVEAYGAKGGGVHLLYRREQFGLSVFRRAGRVDWGALSRQDGTLLELGGHTAWRWDGPPSDGRLVVIEDGDVVITLVGDEPGDAVLEAAAALPRVDKAPSRPQRLTRAVARALELFGPMP